MRKPILFQLASILVKICVREVIVHAGALWIRTQIAIANRKCERWRQQQYPSLIDQGASKEIDEFVAVLKMTSCNLSNLQKGTKTKERLQELAKLFGIYLNQNVRPYAYFFSLKRLPTLSRILDLAAVMFPPDVRERMFVPFAEELKENAIHDKKIFNTKGTRLWVQFWTWANAFHLVAQCLWKVFGRKIFALVALVFGHEFMSVLANWLRRLL